MNSLTLFNSKESFSDKRGAFFAENIKSNYSEDRVIFFPKNRSFKTNFENPLVRECNGLVFDRETNRLLSIPPPLLLHTFKYNIVNKLLARDLYSVYKVTDGTRITAYYYNSKWRFSSARGYDVTDLIWAGDITYKNAFDSILTQLEIDVNEFYDRLDTDRCYSWGFNHSAYHPFNASSEAEKQKNTVWFISSAHLTTFAEFTDYPFSDILKTQELVPTSDGSDNTDARISASDLRVECEQALDMYLANSNNSNLRPLFGYILRSNNVDETGKFSNLIIESSLLWKIRKLYYDNHFKKYAAENKYDRNKYVILYNYLTNGDMFVTLFPKFKRSFIELDKFFCKLKKSIIRHYQDRNTDNYQPNQPADTTDDYCLLIAEFAREMDEKININVDNVDHEEFIKQYTQSIDHIDRLYPFVYM